jgi:hypothetical protein
MEAEIREQPHAFAAAVASAERAGIPRPPAVVLFAVPMSYEPSSQLLRP